MYQPRTGERARSPHAPAGARRTPEARQRLNAISGDLRALAQDELITALREREHDLAEAQRVAHIGSWTWDLATGAVAWSDELHRLAGVGGTDFTPGVDVVADLIHAEDRPAVEQALRAAMRHPGPFSVDHRPASDQDRWVRTRGDVAVGPDGAVTQLHGTVQDVTELITARLAVEDLEDRLAASIRRSSPGVDAAARGAAPDPLTGLPNYALMVDEATRALARAARRDWVTAVLVVDLDDFSAINEAFGHQGGDEVLVEVAARLTETFRSSDMIGRADETGAVGSRRVWRLGGDRFIVVCENVGGADVAEVLAARVIHAVAQPLRLRATDLALTAGVGVGVAAPAGVTFEQLIAEAETALRRAKERGRSQCAVLTEGMATDRHARIEAERSLARAISEGELLLHYQPRVSFDSDRITGVEALVRWAMPDGSLVPPLEFIPLAEETGLIVPLGAWAIEEACRQAARWNAELPDRPPLSVSVNVSARQLGSDLVDVVAGALTASGVAPAQLWLEMTESVLIGDTEAVVATLDGLAGLGLCLSIDDFGTGYSSLAYLKRLPLHELKIDKSFVDGVGDDPDDTAIVAATVAMAHALGLSVIAEGIETSEQFERLRVIGCQEAQGYFVARPGTAEAVTDLLREGAAAPWRAALATVPGGPQALRRPAQLERALLVDDAPDVRQLGRLAFAVAGFDVREAVTGREALDVARREVPDCVILDVMLPDMSGFDVCAALRADPATRGCTIVMLSAEATAEDRIRAFESGADEYIVKPFSPRDLVGRVRGAMRRAVPADHADPCDDPV